MLEGLSGQTEGQGHPAGTAGFIFVMFVAAFFIWLNASLIWGAFCGLSLALTFAVTVICIIWVIWLDRERP